MPLLVLPVEKSSHTDGIEQDERNQFFHESEELRAKLREVLAENDKLRSVGATCEPKRRRAELSPEDDKENVTTNEITIKKQKHSSDSNEPAKKSKKGDANKAFGGEIKANDMAIR